MFSFFDLRLLAGACGLLLVACHWIYLAGALLVLGVAYCIFMKRYYFLHEAFLASLRK